MAKYKQITLGEQTFTIRPMKAGRSFDLQADIAPIILGVATGYVQLSAAISNAAPPKKDTPPPPSGEYLPTILPADAAPEEPKKPYADLEAVFNAKLEDVLPAIVKAFTAIHRDDLELLRRELLSEVVYGDSDRLFSEREEGPHKFDTVMAARSIDVWRLMWLSVKVNYADFFSLLPASLAARLGVSASEA